MSFAYEKLGSSIMQYGLEDGFRKMIQTEEELCEFVSSIETELFACTGVTEALIKHLMFEYLKEFGKEEQCEDIFSKLLEITEDC